MQKVNWNQVGSNVRRWVVAVSVGLIFGAMYGSTLKKEQIGMDCIYQGVFRIGKAIFICTPAVRVPQVPQKSPNVLRPGEKGT